MKFRRIKERKKAKPQKGIFLVILLIIIIYLFMNAEGFVTKLLS